MDEATWLRIDDLDAMIEFVEANASKRRLRLFAVACCRHAWGFLRDERSRSAIEVAEVYADGEAKEVELVAAAADALAALRSAGNAPGEQSAVWMTMSTLWTTPSFWPGVPTPEVAQASQGSAAGAARFAAQGARDATGTEEVRAVARGWQAALFRCIFGNPFRPISVAWGSPDATALARAAYVDRLMPSGELDPALLGVLADALEEAGAPEAVVEHLRGHGPHARGCHVLDALLGRGNW